MSISIHTSKKKDCVDVTYHGSKPITLNKKKSKLLKLKSSEYASIVENLFKSSDYEYKKEAIVTKLLEDLDSFVKELIEQK